MRVLCVSAAIISPKRLVTFPNCSLNCLNFFGFTIFPQSEFLVSKAECHTLCNKAMPWSQIQGLSNLAYLQCVFDMSPDQAENVHALPPTAIQQISRCNPCQGFDNPLYLTWHEPFPCTWTKIPQQATNEVEQSGLACGVCAFVKICCRALCLCFFKFFQVDYVCAACACVCSHTSMVPQTLHS